MQNKEADFIIIGAGIAGLSLAARLATHSHVIVLEQEDFPGMHATGRSAAIFLDGYGPPAVRALARASAPFFHAPPEGFSDAPLLTPRGMLMLVRHGEEPDMEELHEQGLKDISLAEAARRVPLLRTDRLAHALLNENVWDIDVDALLAGLRRMIRAGEGEIITRAPVTALERAKNGWRANTPAGTFSAPVIVNAAGAWVDETAKLAGLAPLGFQPRRRSAAIVPVPDGQDVSEWPFVIDVREAFYFRPSGGALMLSPADETPVEAHDAWADDMAVAEAVENLQETIRIEVMRLGRTWAGLRTFAPDELPVVGFDPRAQGFFWLAGQGGVGILTSPGYADLACALVLERAIPGHLANEGLDENTLSPARLLT